MRLARLSLVIACSAGCFLEPSARVTGSWGGRLVGLDARGTDVRIEFVCSRAVAPQLPVDASGRFEGTAEVTEVTWAGPRPTTLRLSGQVSDGDMSLEVASVWPPPGGRTDPVITHESYSLRRGAPPDFSGYGCLL
jgi:hypothetical protein